MIGPVPDFCYDCKKRFNCDIGDTVGEDDFIDKLALSITLVSRGYDIDACKCVVEKTNPKGWDFSKEFMDQFNKGKK